MSNVSSESGSGVAADDLLSDIMSLLEAEKAKGRERVFLDPGARTSLFGLGDKAVPSPAAVAGRAAPAAVSRRGVTAAPVAIPPRSAGVSEPAARLSQAAAESAAAGVLEMADAPQDLSGYDLEALPGIVAACRRCGLHAGRRQSVFADGSPHAALMFIGEGPGEDEDIQGKPFVGRAGQLLTKMIEAMHLRREDVYIANVVKCRPPGNRTPAEDEARACLPYLERQIALVKPKLIVLLGATPLLHLLGKKGITALHGTWLDYGGIPVMPTYHPAYLLRVQAKKREVWEDLQKVMQRLGL